MRPRDGTGGEPRIQRPYCLRCYAPLGRIEEAAARCPRCGHENLKVDQGIYWTREPWLVRLEWTAKALVVALGLGLSWTILHGVSHTMNLGTGQGWVAGLPILLGAVLWDTASKITRREPYLRAGVLWSWLLGIVGAIALLLGGGALSAGRSDGAIFGAFGLALLALAVSAPRLGRAYERWQVRHVLRGQARTRAQAPA